MRKEPFPIVGAAPRRHRYLRDAEGVGLLDENGAQVNASGPILGRSREACRDLGPDLVTVATNANSTMHYDLGGAREGMPLEYLDAPLEHRPRCAAPSGVQQRHGSLVRHREVDGNAVRHRHGEQRSLGAGGFRAALTVLWDIRYSLVTIVLAGLGRAVAEVGAVIIVGGNIDGVTRVMTTAIALETSKGDLPLALGLGIVLISIVIALNAAAYFVKEAAQRRYG